VTTSPQRLGRLVAALLALGAALFVVGVIVERGDHHNEPTAATTTESGVQAGHDEAAEGHSENSTHTRSRTVRRCSG